MDKDSRTTRHPPEVPPPRPKGLAQTDKDGRTPPPAAPDPPYHSGLLWGLRLWILAALGIIAFALANYILNHMFGVG